jgi:hypothetical protein
LSRRLAATTLAGCALLFAGCGEDATEDHVVDAVPADAQAYVHMDRESDDWSAARSPATTTFLNYAKEDFILRTISNKNLAMAMRRWDCLAAQRPDVLMISRPIHQPSEAAHECWSYRTASSKKQARLNFLKTSPLS